MKCSNCYTDNPDDARFCKQCGSLLTEEARLDISLKLSSLQQSAPPTFQAKIRNLPAPVIGERKSITILFTDIVDSTALAERFDPEDWKEIVSGAHHLVSECVYRYEGYIAQLLGDGVLAFFGAPVTHEDDPVRAVRAGLDIQDTIRAYSDQLRNQEKLTSFQMRIGVNSGPVVVDQVGTDLHAEYLAVGDAVNLAARMQSAAQPGKILLSEDTYQNVAHIFDCIDLGPIEVKGKSEPVHVFQIQGVKARPSSARGIAGLKSRIVGRDMQLETLLRASQAVEHEGLGRVVIVIGEPGLGKSRLIAEWQSLLATTTDSAEKWHWVEGQCLSYGQNLAYHLIRSLLRFLIGVNENSTEDETRHALSTMTGELLGESAQGDFLYLSHLFALKIEKEELAKSKTLNPQSLQANYLAATRRLLLALAAQGPLMLILEDIHWADPSSIDLLNKLLPLLEESPILFCLTARPDRESAGWKLVEIAHDQSKHRLTELTLAQLTTDDSNQLIANLLNIDSLPDDLRRLILSKGEGNPLFVEEVIRFLIDHNVLVKRGDVWSATQEVRAIEVPDTLQSLLLARIDRLVDELKRILRIASVIGRRFPFYVLYHVMMDMQDLIDPNRLSEDLNKLEDTGLIQSTLSQNLLEYLFRHALVQEAAYEAVLKSDRRNIHRAVGHAIEAQFPTRLDELASTLAFHYERGEDWELAIQWMIRAGDHAFAQWALPEAGDLYRRALVVRRQYTPQADVESGLRFKLAQAMMFLGLPREETLAEFKRCLALTSDHRMQAEVYYDMGRLLHIFTSSDLPAAEQYYIKALELIGGKQQDEFYCTIFTHLGYLYRYRGRIQQAVETLERALELAEQLDSAARKADACIYLSGAYLYAGREDDALSVCLQGYLLAKDLGNLELIGRACSFCSEIYIHRVYSGRGSADAALPYIEEMRRQGRENGIGVMAAFGAVGLAEYHQLKGSRQAAVEAWREGAETWLSLRAPTRAAYAHSKCGQLYLDLGDLQAAAEAFELVEKDCGGENAHLAEFYIGYAYAVAGFDSAACFHLQTAFETAASNEQRNSWITTMHTDPEFNRQRSIPGVLALLARYESAQ